MSIERAGKVDEVDGIKYKIVGHMINYINGEAWCCMDCGVLIGDPVIHSGWHNDGST